jgi:hypothetical protein
MQSNNSSNQNSSFFGMGVLIGGILVFLLGLLAMPNKDNAENKDDENKKYVYYDVPTYKTIYEIVYPDSTYRYTAVHHSPSRLGSYRGSNFLHSKSYYSPQQDFERPDYWVDEWNSSELNVRTTAPIRIVSETVIHKKVKYVIK